MKVGRFRCIHQDNWEEGLSLLAKGNDADLKVLALKDLAGPAEGAARKDLADGWRSAAEKEKGVAQAAFRRRAYEWYKQALPKLAGDQVGAVRQRMEAIANQVPDLRDPWRHLDVSEGTLKGEYIRLGHMKCLFTRRRYKGGIDVTVVARTEKNNIRLTAGAGARIIFNWENKMAGMAFDRPDNPALDGRGVNGGNRAASNPRNLEPNTWYTLRWQLTPDGTKIWVDDELVMHTEEKYDLSSPRPVGVCAYIDSAVDVKSVEVKPLSDKPPETPAGTAPVPAEGDAGAPGLRDLDVKEGVVKDGVLRLEGGKCAFSRSSYKGGLNITVVARTEKNNIRITAGPGGRVILNHEGGGLHLDHAVNPRLDGRGQGGGSAANAASNRERNLEPNKWYKIHWELTPSSSRVWIDGDLVLDGKPKKNYDLSVPKPVGICSFDSPIEVKSVEVKPISPGSPVGK